MDEPCDCSANDARIRRMISRQASSASKRSNIGFTGSQETREPYAATRDLFGGTRGRKPSVQPSSPPSDEEKCPPCDDTDTGWNTDSPPENDSSWKDWAPAAAGAAALMALLAFLGQRIFTTQDIFHDKECNRRHRRGCPCVRYYHHDRY